MGRRHLSPAATLAALTLTVAAPASAGVRWHVIGSGAAPGATVSATTAELALDRAGTARFASKLPTPIRAAVRALDFSRTAVVAVFGEFGCRDHRIAVSAVVQQGRALAVKLAERPLPQGTVECLAIFPTYRVLSLDKSDLRRPFPTHATVSLARA